MKVSHRLYVTVAPGVIGVLTITSLAYWGEYARQAPELLVIVAAVAAVVSLVTAWANARFVAQRIERLAGASVSASGPLSDDAAVAAGAVPRPSLTGLRGVVSAVAPRHASRGPDEIDRIEETVERLSHAVNVAQADRAQRTRQLEARVRDHARMMASVADHATKQLDEVKLPLHILLENRFGELNENQEEMLGAARASAEAIDAELVSLRRIAELDLGERPMRTERVRPADLVESIMPQLVAAAESAASTLRVDMAPLLPRVQADRAQLQEALVTLFRAVISSAPPRAPFDLTVAATGGGTTKPVAGQHIEIVLRGAPTGAAPLSIHAALARRILESHGGTLDRFGDAVCVTLPALPV